jgi:hypothetical protein
VICLSCAVRLTAARADGVPPGRREDLAQVLMGLGMIVMLLSWTAALPRVALLVVFGVEAVGLAGLLLRGERHADRDTWECVHHFMASLGMVYMALALTGGTAAGSMPAAPLAAAFGTYFLAYAVWAGLRTLAGGRVLASSNAGGGRLAVLLRRPRLVDGCRAAMGLGMSYLLLAAM